MERLRFPNEISASERTNTRWSYWSPGLDGIVEVGTLIGSDVGLPTHFHCENQITFVHSGRRRFLIGGEVITVLPGQGALIPAGVAHRSLAELSGVACFNVHVPAGEYDLAAMMRTAERMWGKAGLIRCAELAAIVRDLRQGGGECMRQYKCGFALNIQVTGKLQGLYFIAENGNGREVVPQGHLVESEDSPGRDAEILPARLAAPAGRTVGLPAVIDGRAIAAWAHWLSARAGPPDADECRPGFLIRHAKDGPQGEHPGLR